MSSWVLDNVFLFSASKLGFVFWSMKAISQLPCLCHGSLWFLSQLSHVFLNLYSYFQKDFHCNLKVTLFLRIFSNLSWSFWILSHGWRNILPSITYRLSSEVALLSQIDTRRRWGQGWGSNLPWAHTKKTAKFGLVTYCTQAQTVQDITFLLYLVVWVFPSIHFKLQ